MAITTSYQGLKDIYSTEYWDSFEEFESYYLQFLSETLPDRNYYTNKDGIEVQIDATNHYPELKEYEVWVEGYSATGESGKAYLAGKCMGRNFGQACHYIMCKNKLELIENENLFPSHEYTSSSIGCRWDYDPYKFSLWGCRLFWNEKLAKKLKG